MGEEAGVERQAQSSGAKGSSPARVPGCLSPLSSGTGPSGTLVLVLRPWVACASVWLFPGNWARASFLSSALSPRPEAGTRLLPGRTSSSGQAVPALPRKRGSGVGRRGVAAWPHYAPCPQERPSASSCVCSPDLHVRCAQREVWGGGSF